MIRNTLYRVGFLLSFFVSLAVAQGPIITSDGPSTSSPASTSAKSSKAISTSDGPATGNAKSASSKAVPISDGPGTGNAHPNIVTTDGPSVPAYQYPPPVIISNGPAQLPYTYSRSGEVSTTDGPGSASARKVVIIDGPERVPPPVHSVAPPVKHSVKHTSKVAHAKKHEPTPEAETSTLAPIIPPAPQAAPMPEPAKALAPTVAVTTSSDTAAWSVRVAVGTFLFFLCVGTFLWLKRHKAF